MNTSYENSFTSSTLDIEKFNRNAYSSLPNLYILAYSVIYVS